MGIPNGIDPDLLRAFAFIAEEGSFTRAAERIGRTQSAVSMQVQRLEAMLGQKVLLRSKGGTVQLTPHGQYLLDRSRELLALNDAIWNTFRTPDMHGTVRLGTPDDYALRYLPQVLKRFADSHPAVEVEVHCAPSSCLTEMLRAGELDLTLCTEDMEPKNWPHTQLLWRGPLMWITSARHAPHRLDPLPLAVAAEPCAWRRMAIQKLQECGRRWRIAYTSATLAGTHAPVLAGLAVTVSNVAWLPEGVREVGAEDGLPGLDDTGILVLRARSPRQPVTDVLAAHITETFRLDMARQDMRSRDRSAA
jgi:DNA-binding transcriptional LysR family regulator